MATVSPAVVEPAVDPNVTKHGRTGSVASVAPAMTAETVVNISVSGLPVSPPDVAFRIPAPPSDSVEIDEAACILSQFADLVSEEKAIPAVTDSQGFSKVVSNRSDSPPSYSDGLSAIPPGYFDVKLESEPALKRVRSGGASSTVSEPTPVLDHHTPGDGYPSLSRYHSYDVGFGTLEVSSPPLSGPGRRGRKPGTDASLRCAEASHMSSSQRAIKCIETVRDELGPCGEQILEVMRGFCGNPTTPLAVRVRDIVALYGATQKYLLRKLTFSMLHAFLEVYGDDCPLQGCNKKKRVGARTQVGTTKQWFIRDVLLLDRNVVPKLEEGKLSIGACEALVVAMVEKNPDLSRIPYDLHTKVAMDHELE
jgi:hypothetical protein